MAVGEYSWPGVAPINGVRLAAVEAGVRYQNRKDFAIIEIEQGSHVAGIFTQNAFAAEPIKLCRTHLANKTPRYLIINSGNANACTGVEGFNAALATCQSIASETGVAIEEVLPFSTGVIGEVLPADKIIAAIPSALNALDCDAWHDAARAIMTTDTRAKGLSCSIDIDGTPVRISGIAKGSGMIKPNMGTMLAYIATDAAIEQSALDRIIRQAADQSFNRITIDGDTSTNDAMIIVATGKASAPVIGDIDSEQGEKLTDAINKLCQKLALEMVRDAEGATKCVRVEVSQGRDPQECLDVAYAICHSPLVKTAMFASDANWGRIVAAIGYAGIDNLDVSKVNVYADDVHIVSKGGRANTYSESEGSAVFAKSEFTISVQLGRGDVTEMLWTSDLSHDYIKINAEYRS